MQWRHGAMAIVLQYLVAPHRAFMREGKLTSVVPTRPKRQRQFFLFSDFLMAVSPNRSGGYNYKYHVYFRDAWLERAPDSRT